MFVRENDQIDAARCRVAGSAKDVVCLDGRPSHLLARTSNGSHESIEETAEHDKC